MNEDECREYLGGTQKREPYVAKDPHERFAAIVQILSVYEQVYFYAVCRVLARVKAKTAPISVTMLEYQRLQESLNLSAAPGRSCWALLAALETYGFVKVYQRSNRVKVFDQGIPLEDILTHLSGLDYAGELVRRGSTTAAL